MINTNDQKEKNKEILNSILKSQKDSKKSILALMQSFAESTDPIDIRFVDEIKSILEDLKSSLEVCNNSISLSEKLLQEIDNSDLFNNIVLDNFTNASINPKTEPLDENIQSVSDNQGTDLDNIEPSSITENPKIANNSEQSNNISEEKTYEDNTLIISEISGEVILPYELETLKHKLENQNNTYSSIDDIIKEKYTLPISLYKNPFISRFRESYKLMRNKEKTSIKEAFDLGFELMFNYNLHPAIITACKNLDELDIYLDYLESGETDKFPALLNRMAIGANYPITGTGWTRVATRGTINVDSDRACRIASRDTI